LGLFLAKPLRESEATTAPGLLASSYGENARLFSGIFSSVGIFLNIVAQILAAVSLLTSMTSISPFWAAMVSVLLIVFYVIFGGVWGTGMVGILKTLLLYFAMLSVGAMAYHLAGGLNYFQTKFEPFPWFSLFGRGMSTDLAAGFSLLVGVLSTQTYLQAMFSGKSVNTSRAGALISGLIIPPIGLAGIAVGLYMRANFPSMNSATVLPTFVINYLPPWLGGIVLGTLLISIIGTGAGLVLGISIMFSQDIYKKFINKQASDASVLKFSRITIFAVSAFTLIFVSGNLNSLILKWSFLSMGLRGATICIPLLCSIFMKGLIKPEVAVLAIVMAPVCAVLWAIFGAASVDPLYVGLGVSFGMLLLGSLFKMLTCNPNNFFNV
ncbi:MAG: sodium:solute symporter family protein, partial [Dehalobacterium sp.]